VIWIDLKFAMRIFPAPLLHRIWPAAIVIVGIWLTAVWASVLGYKLISFIVAAF